MKIVATLRYLRMAPRKVRLVADLIRGKRIEEAQTTLNFTPKASSPLLLKLLNQAVANAKNNFQLDSSNLYISKITVDEGPKYKRWMARARGRADQIQKKTSHVTIILDEIIKKPKKAKKVKPREIKEEKAPKKIIKPEKPLKEVKPPREQPKLRPEKEITKPEIEKGIKRIFRRKAF
jgi:large subunit ribosomal protein L22